MKLLHFDTAFYVATGKMTWGRGIELPLAFSAANIKADDTSVEYNLTVLLFKPGTPDDVKQDVLKCHYVDFSGNVRRSDEEDLTDSDKVALESLIGFSGYNNKNCLVKPKTKSPVK